MCGLVAMHTTEPTGFLSFDKEEFKNMMVLNSLRGTHSTGIAGFNSRKTPVPNIVKSTGSPYNLFSYIQTDTFMSRFLSEFTSVIGHGRYATQGAVNAKNAHPFVEDHIVLAHNGVISNYHALRDYKQHSHIEVDSQLIARLMADNNPLDVLPEVQGAYVFIWYNTNENTFNIARNDKRPLFMAKQANKNTMTFVSEATTLAWNRDRNNTSYEKIMEVATNKIITFHKDTQELDIKPYTPVEPKIITYGNVRHLPPPKDNSKHGKVKKQSANLVGSLTLGQEIIFEIDDFDADAHYVLVRGYSKLYPDIIFRATLDKNTKEEDIFEADCVTGVVRSIYPISGNSSDDWQVFLGQGELCSVDAIFEDDDKRVPIENFNSMTESITKYRLRELANLGCAWCTGHISSRELENPAGLMLYDTTANEQGILCSHCTEQARKTEVKQ